LVFALVVVVAVRDAPTFTTTALSNIDEVGTGSSGIVRVVGGVGNLPNGTEIAKSDSGKFHE
jgi:hypothetical protein